MKYIALLRGINVGGNNIIKMVDLRESFERMGFDDVSTYIQSGNVIFDAPRTKGEALEKKIEKGLKKDFNYTGFVVVHSANEIKKVIEEAPKGFGSKPDKYRYDVIYFKKPMTPAKAAKEIETKEGVDTFEVGKKALYFSRLTAKATQSKLSKLIGTPVYKYMTIRNWNTTKKLLEKSS